MITVSIKQLVSAIEEADVFKFPAMSDGADYVYNSLYRRILHGEDLRLSHINWDRFELDDVDTMRELYSDVLYANEYKAESMAHTLRGLSPVVSAATFV